ncbi:hypothetical protein R3P38DRAFT_3189108 [Favolaschia claudopus]|uniref:Uncharacterized protein n=1 Tax=Favolaschia claudopus TaxID=2862362 RepID=A0AAW0BUA7_9AGAR
MDDMEFVRIWHGHLPPAHLWLISFRVHFSLCFTNNHSIFNYLGNLWQQVFEGLSLLSHYSLLGVAGPHREQIASREHPRPNSEDGSRSYVYTCISKPPIPDRLLNTASSQQTMNAWHPNLTIRHVSESCLPQIPQHRSPTSTPSFSPAVSLPLTQFLASLNPNIPGVPDRFFSPPSSTCTPTFSVLANTPIRMSSAKVCRHNACFSHPRRLKRSPHSSTFSIHLDLNSVATCSRFMRVSSRVMLRLLHLPGYPGFDALDTRQGQHQIECRLPPTFPLRLLPWSTPRRVPQSAHSLLLPAHHLRPHRELHHS